MKPTRLKISISQDGLLPQETADITTLEFPSIPKKLLKALGFERVDSNTFVGVLPVFVNLLEKDQEIEFELGVNQPEMRKKALEIIQYKNPEAPEKKEEVVEEPAKKKSKRGRKPKSKTKDTE